MLYDALTDESFLTAAGEWRLWRCKSCATGWLDPRPDEASIGDAYESYYTHEQETSGQESAGLRLMLGNGYRNWRFGASLSPAISIGRLIGRVMPRVERDANEFYRYLPFRALGASKRLLDYGCGNGNFLKRARSIGWEGFGVEPDPRARVHVGTEGFDVRPRLTAFASDEKFHAFSMSHVIEHLHDPISILGQLRTHAEDNAALYIATPNLDAVGHQIYGRHWRGLEAPRHLVLFTQSGLTSALNKTGWNSIRFHPSRGALEFTSYQSRKMAAGQDPNDPAAVGSGPFPSVEQFEKALSPGPESEFLIATAEAA